MSTKKMVLGMLFLSVILLLPWIFVGDFYTKGEPREAGTVLSIIQDGRWIIPTSYADEIGYKPPMMHWLIAGASMLVGGVREWTARLPSALGLIGLCMIALTIVLKRKGSKIAVLTTLLLLTGFEMHRSALECRVDMTLAFFMGAALFGLYLWEEKRLKGYPIFTTLCLIAATLVKGPVGFLLPALVFGVYLLLRGYSFGKAFLKSFIVAIPALLVLGVWYFLAWKQAGTYFLHVAFAENFGRVLGLGVQDLGIQYDLGHTAPFWFYPPALFIGLMPWSLFLIPMAVVFDWKRWSASLPLKTSFSDWKKRFKDMDGFTLFAWLVVVLFILFYSLSVSKRSVYILPVYPFVAYLLSKPFIWVSEEHPRILKNGMKALGVLVVLFLIAFAALFFVDATAFFSKFKVDAPTLHDLVLQKTFSQPSWMTVLGWTQLLLVFCLLFFVKKRWFPSNKGLYGLFALFISFQLFLEASVFPSYKNGHTSKPFAEQIETKYDLNNKGYVMNNLLEYRNMYGLNFYLGHHFQNFEKVFPQDGFLVIGGKSLDKVRSTYAKNYQFIELERSSPYNDLKDEIVVCKIVAR